jgi:hypothetical protein
VPRCAPRTSSSQQCRLLGSARLSAGRPFGALGVVLVHVLVAFAYAPGGAICLPSTGGTLGIEQSQHETQGQPPQEFNFSELEVCTSCASVGRATADLPYGRRRMHLDACLSI